MQKKAAETKQKKRNIGHHKLGHKARINKFRRIETTENIFSGLVDTAGEGLLLLLLSHFSRVRLSATPWTAAHQAPPSMGFSRQKYWSGMPLPSPGEGQGEAN